MKYAFVGVTPRTLASGRPLVFGDVVDANELSSEDAALKDLLAPTQPDNTNPDPEAK